MTRNGSFHDDDYDDDDDEDVDDHDDVDDDYDDNDADSNFPAQTVCIIASNARFFLIFYCKFRLYNTGDTWPLNH